VRRFLALLSLVLVLGASAAAARATTEPSLTVRIDVSLTPARVKLSDTTIRRGYYVLFRVRNTTPRQRTFTMAGRTIAIPARTMRSMVVDFLVRGRYRYASRGPSTAVHGIFRVS
jgi:hypothetical protein